MDKHDNPIIKMSWYSVEITIIITIVNELLTTKEASNKDYVFVASIGIDKYPRRDSSAGLLVKYGCFSFVCLLVVYESSKIESHKK